VTAALITPTVLLEELDRVQAAADALYTALRDLTLHRRDFYPQPTSEGWDASCQRWTAAWESARLTREQALAAKGHVLDQIAR
jgi:hypothetical protein